MVTHSDDVILPKAKLIVVMALEVQQCLGPSPSVTGHHKKVLVVPLVALHGVVRGQVLYILNIREKERKKEGTLSFSSTMRLPLRSTTAGLDVNISRH